MTRFIYVVNYYGQISNKKAAELKQAFGNIIFDNVHAFFQKPIKGIDTIYSCRKFFGVPDGGYISTNAVLEDALLTDHSETRMKHILGRFDDGRASDYYDDFKRNEQSFPDLELKAMSRLTHNLLGAIDYQKVKSKREQNFALLHAHLSGVNSLQLKTPVGPYAYPFYCKNGAAIRKHLVENKIYVPLLWPEVLETDQPFERDLAENILPLPCDQRYGLEDMERIVSLILQILNSQSRNNNSF